MPPSDQSSGLRHFADLKKKQQQEEEQKAAVEEELDNDVHTIELPAPEESQADPVEEVQEEQQVKEKEETFPEEHKDAKADDAAKLMPWAIAMRATRAHSLVRAKSADSEQDNQQQQVQRAATLPPSGVQAVQATQPIAPHQAPVVDREESVSEVNVCDMSFSQDREAAEDPAEDPAEESVADVNVCDMSFSEAAQPEDSVTDNDVDVFELSYSENVA